MCDEERNERGRMDVKCGERRIPRVEICSDVDVVILVVEVLFHRR